VCLLFCSNDAYTRLIFDKYLRSSCFAGGYECCTCQTSLLLSAGSWTSDTVPFHSTCDPDPGSFHLFFRPWIQSTRFMIGALLGSLSEAQSPFALL